MSTNRAIDALRRFRFPLVIVLLVSLYLFVRNSGLLDQLNPQEIRMVVQAWGMLGVIAYFGLFSLGQLMYIPGIVFVMAAGLAYGTFWGIFIAFFGAAISISVSFFTIRMIGGTPLQQHRQPLIGKLLDGLHARPVRNVAIMRLIVNTAPWLSHILALSAIQYRHYLLGSLIGIAVPLALTVYFTDYLIVQLF